LNDNNNNNKEKTDVSTKVYNKVNINIKLQFIKIK